MDFGRPGMWFAWERADTLLPKAHCIGWEPQKIGVAPIFLDFLRWPAAMGNLAVREPQARACIMPKVVAKVRDRRDADEPSAAPSNPQPIRRRITKVIHFAI